MMLHEEQIRRQQERFDRQAGDYERHHGDAISQKYRDRFFRDRILDFDLRGLRVLDAMCAAGVDTGFFVERGAEVTGLDISPQSAALYQRKWNLPCAVRSVHDSGFPDASFDVVYICGGLHHIRPLLRETIAEIHRVLRPGGVFCFFEPSADTWVNGLRSLWYRMDARFGAEEGGISYRRQLRPLLTIGFTEDRMYYSGNIGYLLAEQSFILHIPFAAKNALHRPFFALERALERVPLAPKLFFCARWRRRDHSASRS